MLNIPAQLPDASQRRIDIIKQPFAHHKGFSRTAFLAGTTVEAQSAAVAVLLQPAFGGDRRGECRGAEQIVPTAVAVGSRCQGRRFRAVGLLAESRQGVKFAEQGNDRLALTDAGDKGIRDPASIAGELKTFRLQASASRWADQNSSKRVSGWSQMSSAMAQ